MAPKFSLVLSVTRQAPELIVPARPTPRELKQLSDIDDQESFRFHIPVIFLYKNNSASLPPVLKEKDPVKVIKEAISEALVYYYPFAGRLIEGPNRKLMVDCNGEGILFLEAEANFKLEQLGGAIQPPCPYLEQLTYNVPGSEGILGCPLLLIQVTRLMCGGFTLAIRFNHTMCDASGLVQFVKTIEEMATGANTPSLFPVWQRKRLCARNPPQVTNVHLEYEEINNNSDTFITTNPNEMDHKSFYFGPKEVRVLKNQLPLHLRNCSTFELLAACMWRCRTIALQLDPKDTVQFSCLVSARAKDYKMDIPSGYYGNAVAFPAVHSKVGALCNNPLGYAVALVKKAKAEMSEEHIRSAADLMEVKRRRPRHAIKGNYIVSDLSKVGFDRIDLGWGKPVFAGIAGAKSIFSFLNRYQKEDGETGILIPIRLPRPSMKRFEEELKRMIQGSTEDLFDITETRKIACKL